MRILLIILLSFQSVFAADDEYMKFLKTEAQKNSKKFRYNKYESIISGSLAFVVGNIGFNQIDSYSLQIAYSGIQTIGILNVGKGIYDINRPVFDKEMYIALKSRKRKNLSKEVIRILAEEEKAQRLSLLWKSSLLATQYFANAYLTDIDESLKDIYIFLGGVNLIVIGYSAFYKQKYEEFYFDKVSFGMTRIEDNNLPIIGYSFQF